MIFGFTRILYAPTMDSLLMQHLCDAVDGHSDLSGCMCHLNPKASFLCISQHDA